MTTTAPIHDLSEVPSQCLSCKCFNHEQPYGCDRFEDEALVWKHWPGGCPVYRGMRQEESHG